jgi:hypothetical protein
MYRSGRVVNKIPDPLLNELKLLQIVLMIPEFAEPDVVSG